VTAAGARKPSPFDWGRGRYEKTAAELEPVAERVVAMASVGPGDRFLDVACGTGNAALIAARTGAEVTGIDLSPRLIDVARARAGAAGLETTFAVGDAVDLPFDDGAFDVAVSIFGVIFAPDAGRAFGELVRVLRPGGRALVTAWLPEGAMFEAIGTVGRAVAEIVGPPPQRFPWHDEGRMRELAGRHAATVSFEDGEVSFTGESVDAYLADGADHPMSLAARDVLGPAGKEAEVLARMRAVYEAGNEDPSAFRITSRYRIATIETAS
jgi:SAM-dependent methyltransferase